MRFLLPARSAGAFLIVLAVATSGLVAAVPAAAVAGPVVSTVDATDASTAAAASPGPPADADFTQPLLLINGDQLAVNHVGGRVAIAVRPAARSGALTGIRSGGQVLEIPTVALPYLGRGLNPDLFEVGLLARADSGGRLSVQVSFAGRRPLIPGVTITRSAAGSAAGYLTARSARAFGAALARQYRADHARGRYGQDGLFSHGVSIALPGTEPTPRPQFKMHTLTIDGTTMQGRPDTGDNVFVTNVDDMAHFEGFQETSSFFYRGSARFSVPAGHYSALAVFLTGNAVRMVVVPQFNVSGRRTTMHLSENAATSQVTTSVSRPAVDEQTSFQVVRSARTGGAFSYTQSWYGHLTAWVSPTTRKPTVGTLQSYTSATLASPSGVSHGYAYNLDFPGPAGLIPAQHFAAVPADLAAITERYYQDVPTRTAGWVTFGGTPVQLELEINPVVQVAMPQVQTQYFSAGRDLWWNLRTMTSLGQLAVGDSDDFRSFAADQHQSQNWNAYPLHPAADTVVRGGFAALPQQASAARIGNLLELNMTPFSDNQFGHLGAGFFNDGNARVTGSYVLDQDGREIARGSAMEGIPAVTVSAAPSVLRLVLNAARHGSSYPLSASSRTVWTWRSARDTSAHVPPAWYCALRNQVTLVRQCAVQPLISLSYAVARMSLTGQTQPGAQAIEATVRHIQLGGSAPITDLWAQVSFNDGHSWQPATVTQQVHGRFHVAFSAPPGAAVSLRVTATDATGGSVTETIMHGYGVRQ